MLLGHIDVDFDTFRRNILLPSSGSNAGHSFVGTDFVSVSPFPLEFSYDAQMKKASHSLEGNQNPTSFIQHRNLLQGRSFEVPQIACVFRGW
jgi:hypothetical protein